MVTMNGSNRNGIKLSSNTPLINKSLNLSEFVVGRNGQST